jgi:hypothetical protein
MAIFIYHGDDTYQSRQQLTDALKDYPQIKRFEGKEISPEGLIQASGGLFSQENKALVLEGLFSLSNKQLNENVNYIEKLKDSVDFFVWESKRLYPNKINKLSFNKKVKEFKLPNTIFKLLDSIGHENLQQLLNFLQGSFKTHPPEVIFFLIQKRLRQMLLAKVKSDQLSGASWQKRKLYNQVKSLSEDLISSWYIKTINIEWMNKTGRLGRELDEELVNLMVLFCYEKH